MDTPTSFGRCASGTLPVTGLAAARGLGTLWSAQAMQGRALNRRVDVTMTQES